MLDVCFLAFDSRRLNHLQIECPECALSIRESKRTTSRILDFRDSGTPTTLAARVDRHNAGTAAVFTAQRRPVTLVYFEDIATRAAASRERQLKRWTRAKKNALIGRDLQELKRL